MSADYGTTVDIDGNGDEDKYSHTGRPSRCCVRYGNTWVVCSLADKYGMFPSTCHLGPNWPCMLITYCIALGPLLLVFLTHDMATGLKVALVASVVVTTCVFTMVALSDPGVVFESYEGVLTSSTGGIQNGDAELGPGVICAQCQIRRPHNASHCSDCGVCISELDHHCPWTGKCVGKRTIRWFYAFIWCISIHVVLIGVTAATTYFTK